MLMTPVGKLSLSDSSKGSAATTETEVASRSKFILEVFTDKYVFMSLILFPSIRKQDVKRFSSQPCVWGLYLFHIKLTSFLLCFG